MSEQSAPTQQVMPSAAGVDELTPIPAAKDVALEDILPVNPRLFSENRWEEYFERLRREDPVHFNETVSAGRFWSLTRYEEIKQVDTNWSNFSSAHGITLGFPVGTELPEGALNISTFIAMDPPTHDVQRKTVTGVVAPRNLANLEPLIRSRTQQVLDSLPDNTPFDWVDTVSIELTTMMLATLFDFPFEDRRKLTRWSDITFAIPQPGGIIESIQQRRDELLECLDYFMRLKAERLQNPGDDLVSMLAHGAETKDMPPLEYLGNLLLLIVGGNDTTRNTMSGSVYALNQFPAQYDKLIANPNLIPNMVAEVIRWQTPLAYMRRTANEDCTLGGKDIKAGDQLLMWYASGNRDTDVFTDPEQLDIERKNARQHLSFGFGIHRCMGNRLAELQLRILWEEILTRFERIEVLEEPSRTLSSFVKGYTHMPVRVIRK
ncbi:MAG: cytochrome P450 [Proteobacteria bacterium]|jgi:cytochrome P450|nr:cytochrome P450 [Pseudomonadota bacterium]MDA0957159.1 cytochrome P450 [Pseudomonadota bacterium]MDA1207639.1 cytochrome P450 [Pseudomonadota bacterium]